MATVSRFPVSPELESALELGERRFLPVIERLEVARLEAEGRRIAAEARVTKHRKQQMRISFRVDLLGRSAAIVALLAGITSVLDSAVMGTMPGAVVTVLFAISGALCLSALASATTGLRRQNIENGRSGAGS